MKQGGDAFMKKFDARNLKAGTDDDLKETERLKK